MRKGKNITLKDKINVCKTRKKKKTKRGPIMRYGMLTVNWGTKSKKKKKKKTGLKTVQGAHGPSDYWVRDGSSD